MGKGIVVLVLIPHDFFSILFFLSVFWSFILELARQEVVLEYYMWYCAQVSACRQGRVVALSNGLSGG
jgi:hypothetical protein